MKKQTLYIVIGIVVLFIIVAFVFYFKGKKYTPQDIVLPPDSGNPTSWNPGSITDAIYNDLNSTFTPHDAQPYRDALNLSNSQLGAVYNDWNHRYSQKFSGQTIVQAIRSDFTIWNYDWSQLAGALANKIEMIAK